MAAAFITVIAIPALVAGSLIIADELASNRFRFSLRMLLTVTTLAAMALGILACLLRR